MPKKGNAYLAGTVHVAKEVQTIQRYQLEPYMSEKRVKPESATVHVAKCFPPKITLGYGPTQLMQWIVQPRLAAREVVAFCELSQLVYLLCHCLYNLNMKLEILQAV